MKRKTLGSVLVGFAYALMTYGFLSIATIGWQHPEMTSRMLWLTYPKEHILFVLSVIFGFFAEQIGRTWQKS